MTIGAFSAEAKAIEIAFAAGFTAYPVKYENAPFTQPEASPWVALTILSGQGDRADLGSSSPREFITGVIVAQIFVPEDSGTRTAKDIADLIAPLFRNAQIATDTGGVINCRTPYLQKVGVESGWLQLNLLCPFERDETF